MSSDVELLDGAVPLVRHDQPWEWFVTFHEDAAGTDPTDLTGKTVSALVRWRGPGGALGEQTVATTIIDPLQGQVRLSLTAHQTGPMPLGRLSKLFVAINLDTEAVVPVTVMEGLFGAAPAPVVDGEPVRVVAPASGVVIVLEGPGYLYVNNGSVLASLFIRLPVVAVSPDRVEVSFLSPVTALGMQTGSGAALANGPANAYGPGSGLVFIYVDDTIGWTYWK